MSAPRLQASLLERLARPGPLVSVELRPPRSGLSYEDGIDAWIDLYHSIQRLVRRDRYVFFTDDAVGSAEEESLAHLTGNLSGDVSFDHLVPFLTCKHSLQYCLQFAGRAAASGIEALTVVGGDRGVGRPRCVPHAYHLREKLREAVPGLALGGWANPHRDATEQVGYLAPDRFHGEFFLTQAVSHHSLEAVEAFLEELRRQGIELPGVFGVFFYRSANPDTLARLGEFFPVPGEELTREFEAGVSAEEVCARTIRGLREIGAGKVYVSNLGHRRVEERLERILERV